MLSGVKIWLWLWLDLSLEIWENPAPDRFGKTKSGTTLLITQENEDTRFQPL